jgi:hypothetical protein
MSDLSGQFDLRNWEPTPKNKRIRMSRAPNRLRVGGTGSSKSSDMLMEAIQSYLLYWDGLAALWIRRNYGDMKDSEIKDLHEFIPNELFKYNKRDHVATFYNKSTLTFGHMDNNSLSDLSQYLSAAFPLIIFNECGQIAGEAYAWMSSRNRLNPGCKLSVHGTLPRPAMLAATNPLGPHWPWYKTQFVEKRPWEAPEGATVDDRGRYWLERDGKPVCVYDPADWDYVHSTLLDNPHLIKRDPTLYQRLMSTLNAADRERLLYGNMDAQSGQYFDCWDPDVHVVDLRTDPSAIRWDAKQAKWCGQDAGRAHYGSCFWFTWAKVRPKLGGEWREKIVVYRERVEKGKDQAWWADELARLSVNRWEGYDRDNNPVKKGAKEKIEAIWYSHEQFALRMEAHSPAEEYTALLVKRGLPAVSRGTRDRKASASMAYNLFNRHGIVILAECEELIRALPSLMRDEADPEDVVKREDSDTTQKADDCWDGFRHGLYGMLSGRPETYEEKTREMAAAQPDPFKRWFLVAQRQRQQAATRVIVPEYKPVWMKEL